MGNYNMDFNVCTTDNFINFRNDFNKMYLDLGKILEEDIGTYAPVSIWLSFAYFEKVQFLATHILIWANKSSVSKAE